MKEVVIKNELIGSKQEINIPMGELLRIRKEITLTLH